MKDKDKEDIMTVSRSMMFTFGTVMIVLCIVIELLINKKFNWMAIIFSSILCIDLGLLYLTHKQLKLQLDVIE